MAQDKIGTISQDIEALKHYSSYKSDDINSLTGTVDDLRNRVNALEKLLEHITNIDWKTVRFLDDTETF
jgi:polyhydroxyalkanoate synthesis regulator phasin